MQENVAPRRSTADCISFHCIDLWCQAELRVRPSSIHYTVNVRRQIIAFIVQFNFCVPTISQLLHIILFLLTLLIQSPHRRSEVPIALVFDCCGRTMMIVHSNPGLFNYLQIPSQSPLISNENLLSIKWHMSPDAFTESLALPALIIIFSLTTFPLIVVKCCLALVVILI